MPTTRSSTKKQSKLEDFTDDGNLKTSSGDAEPDNSSQKPKSRTSQVSNKRKKSAEQDLKPKTPVKKSKQQHFSSDNIEDLAKPIVINRAPVLQLWGTVVAHFLHPALSWQACLSIGNAISTLCAISKGKAIGMIEPKDYEDTSEKKKKDKDKKQDTQEVSVMGFPLHLKDDAVLMSGKPKPFNEGALKSKFGEDNYGAAKNAMSESLQSWTDDKEELDKKAFHMYETFRPNVAKGQKGWGRKGELNLHEVASVIKRPS